MSWWITQIAYYPLAPEKLATPYDMLSDYHEEIADDNGTKVGDVKKN